MFWPAGIDEIVSQGWLGPANSYIELFCDIRKAYASARNWRDHKSLCTAVILHFISIFMGFTTSFHQSPPGWSSTCFHKKYTKVKVLVNLPLYLIPHHEGICNSGNIAPFIHNLGAIWSGQFHATAILPRRASWAGWIGRVGSTANLDMVAKRRMYSAGAFILGLFTP
jgi:hypothetical protein